MLELISAIDTAVLVGLCFGGVVLGLVVSFRFLHHPDLTIEGSFPLGGALAGVVLVHTEWLPLALLAGVFGGAAAGVGTAIIHVALGVGKLLSGIIMLSALYTVFLRVLGGNSNLSLLQHVEDNLWSSSELTDRRLSDQFGVTIDPVQILLLVLLTAGLSWFLTAFFNSRRGIAIRAVGDNETLLPAFGRDPRPFKFLALALANALAGLSGALVTINQGYADIGMGQGVLVLGLAGLVIGEQSVGRLVGARRMVPALIVAAVGGSILYQGLLNVSLSLGLESSDVKLMTAVLLLSAIVFAGGGNVFYRGRTF